MLLGGVWCMGLSKWERRFWLVMSLLALCVVIYEWYLVIAAYAQDPVRSSVFYKEPKSMRFPSFLVCQRQYYLNETAIGSGSNQPNANMVKYMRIVTNPTGYDSSITASSTSNGIIGSEEVHNKTQAEYLEYVRKYNNNPWTAFDRVMLECDGIVKQCSVGGQNVTSTSCCQQWTVKRLTPVGPCLAVQPPDQEIPSSSGAFQIDLELPSRVYGQATDFGGFDVYIGDAIGKPMTPALTLLDEDAYSVQLAASTYKNRISSTCNSKLQSVFPRFDFIGMDKAMRCTAAAVRKLCQCDPVYKVQLDSVTNRSESPNGSVDSGSRYQVTPNAYQFCDLHNVLQCALPLLNSTRDQSNFTRVATKLLGASPCDTKPPCIDNRYHFAVTEFREMTPSTGNYRSRLRVYYESFVLTEIDQRRSYTFHDIVINLGGALCFWFILVHILVYLVLAAKYYCFRCGPKQLQNLANANGNRVVDVEANNGEVRRTKPNPPPLMVPVRKSLAPVDTVEEVK